MAETIKSFALPAEIIIDPVHGTLLNVQQSAKYLGLTRRRFKSLRFQIGLEPDVEIEGIWPRWSKRVLDIVRPLADEMRKIDAVHTHGIGRAFAAYLIHEMDLAEIEELRSKIRATCHVERLATKLSELLRELGVRREFQFENEAISYRDGMLSVLNQVL